MTFDTIAAPATPPGRGAVAVIRISGPAAAAAADALFHPHRGAPLSQRPSHTLVHGVISAHGDTLDDGLAVIMRAPHSYTGEDVVELHCHGNPLIVERILALLAEHGVRMAERGEFTRRAFLNDRMDLTQAEAVADVIAAAGDAARRAAVAQLSGALASRLRELHDELVSLLALSEACIEFPDDMEDVPHHARDIHTRLAHLLDRTAALLRTADMGRMLHDGYRVVIAGKPNAGKSSLLNALAREERALVTDIPGTTRDTLEVDIAIEGFPVHFIDTAGLRAARGRVEQHGVARARAALQNADLILWVADRAVALSTAALEEALQLAPPERSLWLWNKCDRACRVSAAARARVATSWNTIELSARTGHGLDTLIAALAGRLRALQADAADSLIILRTRQRDLLTRAHAALTSAHANLAAAGISDLLSEDLRTALHAVAELTGAVSSEDILDRIFADFCIGK